MKTPNENKIKLLEKENESLKKRSFNSFSGRIRWSYTSDEAKKDLFDFRSLVVAVSNKKDNISKKVREYLREKYNSVSIDNVSIGEYTDENEYIPFTIRIDGSIKPSDNEIL